MMKSSTEKNIQPVYDITNCGPRSRYMANGKLVHNSDKINVQNLPKRSGDKSLRRSMIAPKGNILIATDSSQVEARLLAYVAKEQRLVDIFVSKRDPYVDMGSKIFNMTYDELFHQAKIHRTKEGTQKRNIGKEAVLACGYGLGKDMFAYRQSLYGNKDAADMAETIVTTYRNSNAMITSFWKTCQSALEIMMNGGSLSFGGPNEDLFYADGSTVFFGRKVPSIRLPNGTYLFYENLRTEPSEESWTGYEILYDQFKGSSFIPTRIYGGKLTENLVQALAFAILKYQALAIYREGIPVNLNVHDEWVSVVPHEQAKKAVMVHAKAMRTVPPYIPTGLLDCEVDIGVNYADMETIEGL